MMLKGWGAKAIADIAGRILALIALGSVMAGCDRCGDWLGAPTPDQSQSCKGQLPAPR
jgi:hypothetical protein